jgi:hypothetical protein
VFRAYELFWKYHNEREFPKRPYARAIPPTKKITITREETKPVRGLAENFFGITGIIPATYIEAKNSPVKKKVRINIAGLGTYANVKIHRYKEAKNDDARRYFN